MDIPPRLQKKALALLQQADTGLLENELRAAKAAIEAYKIFHVFEINACEKSLRMWKITDKDWQSLTRDEQLSAASFGVSHTWTAGKKEDSNPAYWIEKLIWHKQGKLWWPHLAAQWVQGFQHAIETLWKPEESKGAIAQILRLEERYYDYFAGEPFNEGAHNQGLQLLNKWFHGMHLRPETAQEAYPDRMMAQLRALRQYMNRIYAHLIDGQDTAQKIVDEFPDPASMPHVEAARILLAMISENRGDTRFVQSREEARAFGHLLKSGRAACDDAVCQKLSSWFQKASTIPYFQYPDKNPLSRKLLNEICHMMPKS